MVGFLAAGFALRAGGIEPNTGLEEISHIGVVLLLFTVGLKIRLKNVLRAEVWGSMLVHLGLTAAVFAVATRFFFDFNWKIAWILAVALGFSSTVVAAKVLEAKRELRAFHGRVSIGILVLQDLVAVALLSFSGGHSPSPWAFLLLAVPLLRPLVARLFDWIESGELLILFGLLLAWVIGGTGFEHAGLSAELGALVFGAMLSGHRRASELSDDLWSMKEIFLVGFFLQIGMSGLPTWEAARYALLLTLAIPLKTLLFFFVIVMFKLRARTSFLGALALSSYSEFALIVAQMLTNTGQLDGKWLVVLSLAVSFSFVLAAPVNRVAHSLYERYEAYLRRFERDERHPDDEPVTLGIAQIVIVGMGRVGTGAYDFLKLRDERVAGLDSDPGKVEYHLAQGRRVVYADAEDPGFWQNLHLDSVRAVLLAVPDLEAKTFAAIQLRKRGFKGLVSSTNVYPRERDAILQSGCDTTFNYYDEAGVGFAEHTWGFLHGPSQAAPETTAVDGSNQRS